MKKKIVFIDPLPHDGAFTPQSKYSGYTELIPAVKRLNEFRVKVFEYAKANAYIGKKQPGTTRVYSPFPRGIPWITSRYYVNPMAEVLALLERPDIIHHINSEDTLFLHGVLKTRLKGRFKLVATVHLPLSKFFVKMPRTWKRFYGKVDYLITLSSRERKFFQEQLEKVKVVQIPHGNNNSIFQPSILDPHLGVCIGGHLRDFPTLVKAMEEVSIEHPEFKLFIISRRKPIGFQMPKNERIRMKFNIPDELLLSFYKRASIMILPLSDCTANNALLESLASGIPIITNRLSGTLDYLDPTCALFFEKGNAKSLADKINYLLDNPVELKKMGKSAREKSKHYDWSVVSERIKNEVYLGND
ncbi:MAG: glycosyltransferase family 4 protein [Promethearchaeota archaeon]